MNDKVMFTFSTKNIFHGRLYVKGRFSEERCRKTFFDNEELGGNFSMPLGICGMQRLKTVSKRNDRNESKYYSDWSQGIKLFTDLGETHRYFFYSHSGSQLSSNLSNG